ncbi:MAG: helix-turn-helix domain-containing protein [Sphingobacteriales bacterium]|nr:helix-turn-helix domain-containing protein [Sphingobacteriales bacterium]
MKQWYPLLTEEEYRQAAARLEEIYLADEQSVEYREMKLLVLLISEYEKKHYQLPEVDPVELIRIRMEDFGYTAKDLAKEYGDKGTVSKVLNYKQPLSLTMIRKFSKLLRIPADSLTKEYKLHV